MDDLLKDVAKEVCKETVKDISNDIAKPAIKTLGLIPRAIKAALMPLEVWIEKREHNTEKVRILLEKKLENVNADDIETPEMHIAIPALQYISYCMDNEELRNMYANLLASSMDKIVKNEVHPAFVETIKQLSPDEAKVLRYLFYHNEGFFPTISLNLLLKDEPGAYLSIIKIFSHIGELSGCEKPRNICAYFDNLIRLGLISIDNLHCLVEGDRYRALEEHKFVREKMDSIKQTEDFINKYDKFDFAKSAGSLTDFGKAFCKICVADK